MRPDPSYFSDPATRYPVTLDPTVNLLPSLDTWEDSGNPTLNYDTDQHLFVGPYFGGSVKGRGFVKFDDSVIKSKNVTSSTLSLYQNSTPTCATTPVNVQGSSPLGAGTTWNTQPTMDGHVWSTGNFAGGNSTCPSGAGYKTSDLTALTQQWAATVGTTSDTLAVVAANEADTTQFKDFLSNSTIAPPQLSVTYLTTPSPATNLSPASGSQLDTLAPTLTATVGGGDGSGYNVFFALKDTVTNNQVAAFNSLAAAGPVAWTVPASANLIIGRTYQWQVTNCEGFSPPFCAAPVTATFTVDASMGAGDRGYYTYLTRQVNDRTTIKVNPASGNLLIENKDLQVAGVGNNLSIRRNFNSLSSQNSILGNKWQASTTATERLIHNADGSFTFYDDTGNASLIAYNAGANTYQPSAETDASFIDGGGYGVYSLTFNHDRGGHHAGDIAYFFNSGAAYGLLYGLNDKNGNQIAFTYSGSQATQVIDTEGRPVTFNYASGRLSGLDDPNGDPTNPPPSPRPHRTVGYIYDINGDLHQFVDANGQTTTYDYANHNVTKLTTSGGRVWNMTYDSASRVKTLSYVDGANTFLTTLTYNPYSGLSATTDVLDPNQQGSNPAVKTTYIYDNADRVTNTTDALNQAVATTYDNQSNVSLVTDHGNQSHLNWSGSNNLNYKQSATGALSNFTYTAGTAHNLSDYQPQSGVDAQGNSGSFSYETGAWNQMSTTGPTGTKTVTRKGIGGVTCANAKQGSLCSSNDGLPGHTTDYAYNTRGDLQTITPPAPLGVVTFALDTDSRRTSITDGRNQTQTMAYDSLDRVRTITYAVDGTTVQFTYDNDGNVLTRKDRDNTTWTSTYDGANRLKATTHSVGTIDNISYTYDGVGNLKTMTGPAGVTSYSYTAVNQPYQITAPGGAVTTYTYQALHDNWRSNVDYPNNTHLAVQYDGSGRTTSIIGRDSTGAIATSFTYTYANTTTGKFNPGVPGAPNPNGDTGMRQTTTRQSDTTSYSYDGANELTNAAFAVNGGPTTTYAYAYDAAGNRVSATVNGSGSLYGYNNANELTTGSAAYDGNGNLTAASGYGFSGLAYNPSNQTSSITPNAAAAVPMTYAGTSQDDWTRDGATRLVNAGSLGIVAATPYAGGAVSQYNRDSQGMLLSETTPQGTYYYLYDGQGSVVALTNSAGLVVQTYSYDPYGGTTTAVGTVVNPWRYTGGYKDDQTGLYKYGARHYNPGLGQWTQRDPSGQDANPYAYVSGNPVNGHDPTGRWCIGPEDSDGACQWADGAREIAVSYTTGLFVTLECGAIVAAAGGPEDPFGWPGCFAAAGLTSAWVAHIFGSGQ